MANSGSWTKETRALIHPGKRGISKLNRTVRDTFLQVFNEIQDATKYPKANLLQVAQDSPALFYTLASKLIPTEVIGSMKSVINVQIPDITEDGEATVLDAMTIITPETETEGDE